MSREEEPRDDTNREETASRTHDISLPEHIDAGYQFGHYRLEEEIGAGGMGKVFLAVREDDINLRVALKVVRYNHPVIVSRIEKERSILARLEHPNIARIIDAGVNEGLPWFAMEYVDGEDILTYSDQRKLSIRARVKLFFKVCRALAHAHQKLVIHRDLKPSNIMVDHEGEPKLLDFGIAAMLDPESGEQLTMTHMGASMTPQYASPEQVRGEHLSAGSDVYSLGVVLYELLGGRRPYAVETGGAMQMMKAVCESEPTRLSHVLERTRGALTENTQDAGTISAARGLEPKGMRRALKGDLENIVAKALSKQVSSRYESVEAFSEDLVHYLNGRPVRARHATRGYRLRKFLSRNPLPVTLATLLFVSLSVFSVVNYRQRAAMERERNAAARVTGFLESLFWDADPNRLKGQDLTAVDLVDRGAEKLDAELGDDRRSRARMSYLLGGVYMELGAYEKAGALADQALALRRSLSDASDLLDALLLRSTVHWEMGEIERAEALAREALTLQERRLPRDLVRRGRALNRLGMAVRDKGRDYWEASLPYLREALAVRKEVLGPDEIDLSDSHGELAFALHDLEQFEEAERLYRIALEMDKRILGDLDVRVATSYNNLGILYMQMGDTKRALELMNQAYGIYQEIYGRDYWRTARADINRGRILYAAEDFAAGAKHFRAALPVYEATYGVDHEYTVTTRLRLAHGLVGASADKAAYDILQRWLPRARELLDADDRHLARALRDMGELSARMGDSRAASGFYREAIRALDESDGDPGERAEVRVSLAELLCEAGDGDGARRLNQQARNLLEGSDGPKAELQHRLAALESSCG